MQYLLQIFTGSAMEAFEQLSEAEQGAVSAGVHRDRSGRPA